MFSDLKQLLQNIVEMKLF